MSGDGDDALGTELHRALGSGTDRAGVPRAVTSVAVVANAKKLRARLATNLRRALADAGQADAPWFDVTRGSDASKAAAKALKHGVDAVIVCGGDGTVRAAAQALVGTTTALAVVPAGTANLFAEAMELPSDPADVVDLVVRGERRTIDTGTCNGVTFTVMGGTGLDASMIRRAEPRKERFGSLAYAWAGVSAARRREPIPTTVTVDGTVFYEGPATCVLVGNLGQLEAGLVAFPDASPSDGRLDVGVVTAVGLRQWGSLMASVVRRRGARSGHSRVTQGCDVTVRLASKQRFELDGGTKGRAKTLRFSVEPASLVLCAPPAR